MKHLIYCVLVVLMVQLAAQAQDTSADIIQPRRGVANFCRELVDSLKLERVEGRRKVIYFGNNFLYSDGYVPAPHFLMKPAEVKQKKASFSAKLNDFAMRELVPGSAVSCQTSTTDNPSWKAAFHINQRGVLLRTSGGFPPDAQMVVLDFAYNDRGLSEQTVSAGMEGMIHQIWKVYPNADIIFLYTPNTEFLKDYRSGKEPQSITFQEKVARHYNLPSINLAKYVSDKIIAGEVKEEDIFLSASVVSDAGDQLCVEAIKPLLVAGLDTAKKSPKIETPAIPQLLSTYPVNTPLIEEYITAKMEPGWLDWQLSPVERYLHVLKCQESGPTVSLRFKGSLLGMTVIVGPDSGDIEYSVNGSAWKLKKCFSQADGGSFNELPVLLVEGADPAVEHEIKLRVAPETPKGSTGKVVRIVNFPVNGQIIYDDPFKGMTQLQRIDKIYSELEPLKYKAPADRWKNIPNTMKKLTDGPGLTIVMLGDSIVNDTSGSDFELLIGRMYPKCKVKKVTSVRGSTGCDWYEQENRVQEYVLKHNPDLLIIGGISNRGKTPQDAVNSIREVIKQVRAAKPDTEVLLMTGPFGYGSMQDPKLIENWQEFVTPEGTCYRSCLMKAALEDKADFIDMYGIMGRYLLDSKFPYGSFQRDPIHANWRGKQVLGRFIEKYFEPK